MDTDEHAGNVPDQPVTAVGYAGVLRDLLPVALWKTDTKGVLVEWSLAAQELLGYTAEQLLGRNGVPILVPEANWELAERLIEKVIAGETIVGALPVRHRDGRIVPMEMWICPSPTPGGAMGVLVVAVETSAILRMRDALAAMEGLFTQSPIGLAMLDPDLRYLRVNDALARMNGVPAAGHLGKRPSDVAPGAVTRALERVMRQALASGVPVVDVRGTGRTRADPEHDRTWSCSCAPLLDTGGQGLGLIASLIDITEGQRAQAEAEQARRRFALLAEAGTRVGTTLDLRQTADEVVRLLVPQVSDSADVQLFEEIIDPDEAASSSHGVLRRVAVTFPDSEAPTAKLVVGMTFQVPAGTVYEQVIAEGRSMNLFQSDLPALMPGPQAERLRTYFGDRMCCARLVPLVARGRVLGAVVLTRTRDREPFDDQDCVLIDELVARAALSIDNARMYTAQRAASLALRRSLTHSSLPRVTGLELAGRYLPASDQAVGGDWFDAFALPDGSTGLVIGDVMGHGVHSAAVMGQLRTAVRTLARHGFPPDRILSSLDAAVAELGEHEMATCVYAVHDPVAGSCEIARAGHPPPAVVDPLGAVTFLDGPPGVPLGTCAPGFQTERVALPPGSLLVLYTDGLIETRDRDLDQGMRELAGALRQLDHPLDEISDRILDQLLTSEVQDDVALLLARALPRTTP
ncbi:SpoIIE family protein phosphatase [Streptomyces sp. NPDC127084]|uniref:SpoIIE family protein phosphatase n=1 Tax=Streptomyces sp. NPDC127084 TaxID=3347133 RepID=UPI003647E1BA